MHKMRHGVEYFDRRNLRPLHVYYEDLIDAYDCSVRYVLQYLGTPLPPGQAVPRPRLRDRQMNGPNGCFAVIQHSHRYRSLQTGVAIVQLSSCRGAVGSACGPVHQGRISHTDKPRFPGLARCSMR